MTTTTVASSPAISGRKAAQVRLQRFGAFLSGMIMPNLSAFVAWGLITSLFIAVGWTPNAVLGGFGNANVGSWQGAATQLVQADDGTTFRQYLGLVGPMITYLLPLLIANAGGRIVYGERGGVVGSIATVGIIVGSTVPMFLGAMVMGPLAAWIMKKVDALWHGKIKPGFEMLVEHVLRRHRRRHARGGGGVRGSPRSSPRSARGSGTSSGGWPTTACCP